MKKKMKVIKIFAGVTAGVLLLRILLFPPYRQPQVTGGLTVKVREFTWVDESRTETFTDTGKNGRSR